MFTSIHQSIEKLKIMKRASTAANHAILTEWVKVQHEKKPVLNFKNMQFVGSGQINISAKSMKYERDAQALNSS